MSGASAVEALDRGVVHRRKPTRTLGGVAVTLVAWARLTPRRHNVPELVGGLVLGSAVGPLVLVAL